MAAKPQTIDDYLSALDDEKREALEKVRKAIRAAAPKAEECISYGLPAYRQEGLLVGFGASKKHCAFYPMSGATVKQFEQDLKGFDTSKGTIRFQPDEPLPASLIRKLVKTRLAENMDAAKKKR